MEGILKEIAYKPESRRTRSEKRFIEARIAKEAKEHAKKLSSEGLSTEEIQNLVEEFKAERSIFYSRGLVNALSRAIKGVNL